ncbi:hypothetical protein BC826DRAFT_1015797 [Russula brevipes]|nr:hypothetical protein BC826DRAFT_1015797 [Russula brevipes]
MRFENILTTAPPGATKEGTKQIMSEVRQDMSIPLLPTMELHLITSRAHQDCGDIGARCWYDKPEGGVNTAGILYLRCLHPTYFLPDTGFTRRRLLERGRIELSNSILGEYRNGQVRREVKWTRVLHMNWTLRQHSTYMISNNKFLHRWLKVHGHIQLVLRRHRHTKL